MLWIKRDKWYAYSYTTGRWHPYVKNSYPKKHYRSNGIDDFITRFTKDSKIKEKVDSHLGCFSYPNCDIDPSGCTVYNDDYEEYKNIKPTKKTDNNNQLLIKKMITEIKLKAASLYPI